MIGADRRVALHDAEPRAVVVAGPVQPRQVVEAGDLDHEGVTLPAAVRPAHPGVDGGLGGGPDGDGPVRARELIGDDDPVRALEDLERVGQVGGARHAGVVALGFGIADRVDVVVVDGQPPLEVRLPAGQGLGPVGDLAALDDARPRGLGAPHAQQAVERPRLRAVGLQVPVGRGEGLPDAVQIGIRRPRQPGSHVAFRGLAGRRPRQEPEHRADGDQHRCGRTPKGSRAYRPPLRFQSRAHATSLPAPGCLQRRRRRAPRAPSRATSRGAPPLYTVPPSRGAGFEPALALESRAGRLPMRPRRRNLGGEIPGATVAQGSTWPKVTR